LIGEERRIDQKKVIFFCLDRQNGQELWQHASLGDSWWIGIEAVCRDTVFFHGFANPNLPLHRGIIAVDVLTGKRLWEDQELEFIGTADDSIVGSKETSAGRSIVALDRRTGMWRDDLDDASLHAQKLNQSRLEGEVELPVPLEQSDTGDPHLGTIIRRHYETGTLAGPVEIVEGKEFVIFDHHEVSANGTAQSSLFSSLITVVERATGTRVYRDTMSSRVPAVIPELFFVQHGMFYYLKERQALIAVRLASLGVNHVRP
jgi:hypothetical protein